MASETPSKSMLVIESTSEAAGRACEKVLSELEANGLSQDDIFAIHLALEEALVNAVKHGNKMDASKEVKLDYSVAADKVEINVTDEGVGFKPKEIPDPRFGENVYKVNGRGLFLIRAYMDVVEYNDLGNRIHMVRYKEKPSFSPKQ